MYKILAVDDEPHALKILKVHLQEAGYDVVTATNGEEALAVLAQHANIDVILLDRMMPKMDGMEFLRRVKAKESAYRHIPVIMQTAKREEWEAYEGVDAGAIHYLTKPYVRETLLATLETVLRDMEALKAHFSKKE